MNPANCWGNLCMHSPVYFFILVVIHLVHALYLNIVFFLQVASAEEQGDEEQGDEEEGDEQKNCRNGYQRL